MNDYPVADKTVKYTSNGRVSGTHRPDEKNDEGKKANLIYFFRYRGVCFVDQMNTPRSIIVKF